MMKATIANGSSRVLHRGSQNPDNAKSICRARMKSCQALAFLGISLLLPGVAESAASTIQWGVDVHYRDINPKVLASRLKECHFTCVRLDLWGRDTNSLARFRAVASVLHERDIRIEAILFTSFARGQSREYKPGTNLKQIESAAYAQTQFQVERTKDLVQDYELQNEVSLYPHIKVKGSTGQSARDFDTPTGRLQAAVLRGMSRAIADVRRSSHLPLRIILTTTDRSFGFLSFMQQQGVVFEVVGYHIYPWEKNKPLDEDPWFGPGGPLGQLAKFGKPIVINEFNSGEIYSGAPRHPGPNYENQAGKPETELGFRSLDKHLKEIVNQKVANVEAVLFYELCDEPEKKIPENRFGLFYDTTLQKPKISLLIATSFAGGTLSPAEQNELTKRGLGCRANAPWSDPGFFPLAVWLQSPANAERYHRAGFNTYVGLWHGPTEKQLAALEKARMWIVCSQNQVGLQHLRDPAIIAWMHDDEPDNAQSHGARFGFGSPIPPQRIVEDYNKMRAADPSRPVLLNLGQGVAWDGWYGRGRRNHHPEDYPEYLKGCDIASFDIYPVNHAGPEVAGKLWYVARGVDRLIAWSHNTKPVWNCIECTAISKPKRKPTPHQVRCEVWMSIIHGSRGLIYFVHQIKPVFREAALLDDPKMLAAVTALNHEISRLAPVLNAPSLPGAVTVHADHTNALVSVLAKRLRGVTYIFAVEMRGKPVEAVFTLKEDKSAKTAEVIGEDRSIPLKSGVFRDKFGPWDVHLYRLSS